MISIHMDTDLIRQTARQMNQSASEILAEVSLLQSAFGKLEVGWQNGSSESIIGEFRQTIRNFETQSDQIQNISTRLNREVDEWENADRSFGVSSQNQLKPITALGFTPAQLTLSGMLFSAILPITKQIDTGIRSLYGIGMDVGNSLHSAGDNLIRSSDRAIDGSLKGLLLQQMPGSKEMVTFKTEGEVEIPGIEIAVPGSMKLAQASEGALTRNPDGTYTLMLKGGGGVGLEEDLLKAKGNLRFGNWKVGGGAEVGGEALISSYSESQYQFDPQKAGEMTKMTSFLTALGLLSATSNSAMVGPALYTLKDNLVGIKTSSGLEGKFKADAHVLMKLVGVKNEGSVMLNSAVNKTTNGIEIVNSVELDQKSQTSLFGTENGTEYKISLDAVRNQTTGAEKARVTIALKREVGDDSVFRLKDLENYIPKSDLNAIKLDVKKGAEIKVEYELDQPAETLKRTLFTPDGKVNRDNFKKNVHITVSAITSKETGVGAKVGVGGASQSVGLGLDMSARRSSEVIIYAR